MKIKKVTLGLIFGSLAFSILFLVLFTIVGYSMFSPFINGLPSFVALLVLAILSIYCFLNQMIATGSFIERYLKSNDYKWFTRFFWLLLLESLNKRISVLSAKKIITLNEWAKRNKKNINSYLNKAKRQTIPAFRKGGKWMVAEEFEG